MRRLAWTALVLGVIGLGFVSAVVRGGTQSDNSSGSSTRLEDIQDAPEPPSASGVDLTASVNFDGAQFTIVNGDSFAWSECKLDLNGGLIRSGYVLNAGRLDAGSTYTVGAAQFANGDGERFNPFTMKPQNLFVICDTPRGRGSFSGDWN